MNPLELDALDRAIINGLQGGFPLSARPYRDAAARLGMSESELLFRLERLLNEGILSRFGPLYNAERLGGAVTLAAMQVPPQRLDQVAQVVNALPQVAHNYERDHPFNLWFVIAVADPGEIPALVARIEADTGLPVYQFPKVEEFYIGARFEA